MAFHIVTSRCFIACEKVTSVVIEENIPERTRVRPKKARKKTYAKNAAPIKEPPKQFTITVSYYPLAQQKNNQNGYGNGSGNGIEECSLDLRVIGKKEAYSLYAEIIKEVREQHPNEGYLDELVDRILLGSDFKDSTDAN